MTAVMRTLLVASSGWLSAILLATVNAAPPAVPVQRTQATSPPEGPMFALSSECVACHNNLVTSSGEDVSIGASWRGTMMANAGRDPYVLASIRRETMDHSSRARDVEDECATCHLPAAQKLAHANGDKAAVFAHFANANRPLAGIDALAQDGVSCTVCHQIAPDRLGTRDSFNGNFVVAAAGSDGMRRALGPLAVDPGRRRIMHSVTGFVQAEAPHVRESALCATCHTLITEALGPDGQVIGSLPEQMNYQEWQHSSFSQEGRSCQSCHMPRAPGPVRVASVLGEDRPGLSRHTFVGGNAFMLRLMNRYRAELGVEATSAELESIARATIRQLEQDTASVEIDPLAVADGMLAVDVRVRNLTGHKFPTGYPSRRAWLHVVARDKDGRVTFESGRVTETGLIEGNDSDASAEAFEPHHTEITRPDQVQIYESIMGTPAGTPTTGLLQATRYLKDNRLLPRGFDKRTAAPEIAVVGAAAGDDDFTADGDRVRYRFPAGAVERVEVELRFQPIAYRWARNLARYAAREPRAFVSYYDAMAVSSSQVVARTARTVAR